MQKTIDIDIEKCCKVAYGFFKDASGIYGDGSGLMEFQKQAERAVELCTDRFIPRATYAYYDDFRLHGRTLSMGGVTFTCPAFEQIDPGVVKGVFTYVASAGDFYFPDLPVVDQVYTDLWGTALTDALREIIHSELEKVVRGTGLSDDFGPGFYGMDAAQLIDMTGVIDFYGAGVELNASGMMEPVKACAGLLFDVTGGYRPIGAACQECMGNVISCRLCRMRGQ